MNQTINDLSRIKWRCRRGTKELDFLLLNYFNQKYKAATEEDTVDQMMQMSYQDLRRLQETIESGETDGVPRELIG